MKLAQSRLLTCAAVTLIIGALAFSSADAGLFGRHSTKKRAERVQKQSLVVFPFDQASANKVPEAFGQFVATDLKSFLADSSTKYTAYLYTDRLSPIKRAKDENFLKNPDVVAPFAEDSGKALKLAQLLATDFYLVGEIEDFQFDQAKGTAEMVLQASLYNAKNGKLVKTFVVSGKTSDSNAGKDADELRDLAKGAAVTRLVAELSDQVVEEAPAPAAAPVPADAPKAPEHSVK